MDKCKFLLISSIQLYSQSHQENHCRSGNRNFSSSGLGNPDMVSYAVENSGASTHSSQTICGSVENAITARPEASITQESDISYLSCIRETLQLTGLSEKTIEIILSSWRKGTKSQYQSFAKKWFEFAKLINVILLHLHYLWQCNFFQTCFILVYHIAR